MLGPGAGPDHKGVTLSKGKKFVAITLLTFIALIVAGAMWGHHAPADPTGTGSTTAISSYQNLFGRETLAPSQVDLNKLATDTGHVGVGLNFTWMLMCGFLVLFMQVGFAFLVTGLTRAKNAAHMMMMNIAAFAVAFIAYYGIGFAFQFGGIAPVANLGGLAPLTHIFPTGNWGLIGLKG